MTRKTWVHHPITGKMVPKADFTREKVSFAAIHGDIEAFVSPVDGSIISDRTHLRDHNRRHEVTNVADYGPDWFARRGKEKYREQQGTTPAQKRERREAINRTMREKGM
jgi:hypothetical protein